MDNKKIKNNICNFELKQLEKDLEKIFSSDIYIKEMLKEQEFENNSEYIKKIKKDISKMFPAEKLTYLYKEIKKNKDSEIMEMRYYATDIFEKMITDIIEPYREMYKIDNIPFEVPDGSYKERADGLLDMLIQDLPINGININTIAWNYFYFEARALENIE